jgi:transcriptional regulator with XRE-family HTH domain
MDMKMKKNNKEFDLSVKGNKQKREYDLIRDLLAISEEVYSHRMGLKFSQEDLAKKVGTTQKVISKIENAEVNFGVDLILRISRVLKMQVKFGGFSSLPEMKDETTHIYNIVSHNLEDLKKEDVSFESNAYYYSPSCSNKLAALTNN